jgi:hypothetical protein
MRGLQRDELTKVQFKSNLYRRGPLRLWSVRRGHFVFVGAKHAKENDMQNQNDKLTVLKLKETHADEIGTHSDAGAMFRIWTLLTDGEQLRDLTVANRSVQ